MSQFR